MKLGVCLKYRFLFNLPRKINFKLFFLVFSVSTKSHSALFGSQNRARLSAQGERFKEMHHRLP